MPRPKFPKIIGNICLCIWYLSFLSMWYLSFLRTKPLRRGTLEKNSRNFFPQNGAKRPKIEHAFEISDPFAPRRRSEGLPRGAGDSLKAPSRCARAQPNACSVASSRYCLLD